MESASDAANSQNETLRQVLDTLKAMQHHQSQLSATVAALNARVEQLTIPDGNSKTHINASSHASAEAPGRPSDSASVPSTPTKSPTAATSFSDREAEKTAEKTAESAPAPRQKRVSSSRIILTTYPGQSGIDPIPLDWGNEDPLKRGPVVVSRNQNTVRRRNGSLLTPHISCTSMKQWEL